MATASSTRRCARFDQFEVDFNIGELRKSGQRIALQDQPFHILRILSNPPRKSSPANRSAPSSGLPTHSLISTSPSTLPSGNCARHWKTPQISQSSSRRLQSEAIVSFRNWSGRTMRLNSSHQSPLRRNVGGHGYDARLRTSCRYSFGFAVAIALLVGLEELASSRICCGVSLYRCSAHGFSRRRG